MVTDIESFSQRVESAQAGDNVGCGKDYTLFATADGKVQFQTCGPQKRKYVSIVPD